MIQGKGAASAKALRREQQGGKRGWKSRGWGQREKLRVHNPETGLGAGGRDGALGRLCTTLRRPRNLT